MTIAQLRWMLLAWLVAVAMVSGCTSRPSVSWDKGRPATSNPWEIRHAQLLQHGRFSDAAVLAGLHDEPERELGVESGQASPASRKPQEIPRPIKPVPNPQPSQSADLSLPVGEKSGRMEAQNTPLDGSWHLHMGWTFLIHGNYDGAIAAYREALRHNDRLPQAFLGLGIALRNHGKLSAAKSAIHRALRLAPRYAAALVHLGYLYADGPPDYRDYAKARQLFRLALQQGDPFAAIALRDLDARERT